MRKAISVILLFIVLLAASCYRNTSRKTQEGLSVLVFITGFTAGSPTYELMAEGALEFERNNPNVNVKIYEAGFNQAMWEQQLIEMISTGEYDIVLSSNPSLPELCVNAAKLYPGQKFIITDALYEGNPQIKTYFYNQYEQSLFLGYLAGLITTSAMPHANPQKRIGFIAAQEYPLLTRDMIPGFTEGAKLVDPEIEIDRRIIGSWADANKAAELASAMIDSGVDVFTSIAGGAAQGMIKTVTERGGYIVSYNANEYHLAPGFIVGCGFMEIRKLVIEILEKALAGEIEYGTNQTIGLKEGYLGFEFNGAGYRELPDDIKERFERYMEYLNGN